MNIQQLSQTNPSFEQLKAPRKLRLFDRKLSRKQLLEMPVIKDNIDRFDIILEPKKKQKDGLSLLSPSQIIALSAIGTGGLSGLLFNMAGISLFGTGILAFLSGFAGICLSFNLLNKDMFQPKYWEYELFGKKKYSDGTEIKTESFRYDNNYGDKYIDETIKQLKNADRFVFLNTVTKNYPENGVFDSKSILKILTDENVKKDFANGEAFNYSIDVNGHDSLLTKFFELSKSEAKTKEYQEIVSIIKSTPNINFHQKDAAGISILENVLNMENSAALDLIKDLEFEHSAYIDSLFNNIQDEDFKAKVKNLKIKFKDPVQILLDTKKMQDFEDTISQQLESPFCDAQKIAREAWQRIFIIFGKNNKIALTPVNKILYKYLPENMRMD